VSPAGAPWLMVMAGGSGTRFWPRSRAKHPKQFLQIGGDHSLMVTTLNRFRGWIPTEHMLVLTTKALEAETKAMTKDFPGLEVLAEPESRNTGPSLVMAMEWIRARDPDAVCISVAADHWITEVKEYIEVMKSAVTAASDTGSLCTVGIQPTRPETGYGYIRVGERVSPGAYRVERFVEKPSREVAETMVQTSEYLWNSGMFIWTANSFFRELEVSDRRFVDGFAPYREAMKSGSGVEEAMKSSFFAAPAISIDYALLEKSRNVIVVLGASFQWSDVGSFVSLEDVYAKSEGGVARAEKVIALDSLANIVDAPGKTVALLGVTDMILVDAGDVILLATKERAQDVKKFVERLKAEGRTDLI
jgi:mannose-1-phosphate guanylyltransferase